VLISNLKLTSGFNGLTGFTKIFGRNKYQPSTNKWLYMVAAIGLLVVVAVAMKVVRSRYGKLLQATRDSEDRVRFLGYDPAIVKAVGFMIAAGMAGLAGAIAAPVFGIVSPGQFDYVPSILMVCWVAVGGRGTLWGAVLGALVVNWARVKVSDARPDDWLMIHRDRALRGLFESGEQVERRRLATARWAEHQVKFALGNLQFEIG